VGSVVYTEPSEIINQIPDGSNVILPGGCAEPTAFYDALSGGIDKFEDLHLFSGLQFGPYSFLDRGLGDNFSYTTWHVNGKARKLAKEGAISYLPLRFSEVGKSFPHQDYLVIQTGPPKNGKVNMGVSVSMNLELLKQAKCVIAEVTDQMPETCGESVISTDQIDFFVHGETGPSEVARSEPGELEVDIAKRVLTLIPEGGCVQLGIGGVPESIIGMLAGRKDIRLHTGMVTDGFIPFLDQSDHPVTIAEVFGTREIFDYVHNNPQIELRAATHTHSPTIIGANPKFTSINSALEIDLTGQVNAEAVRGTPVAGIGGSLDFFEGAARSDGGQAVIALASTAGGGKHSRIVPQLAAGASVTIPRYMVHNVVTEHGIADLRGKSLHNRAIALAQVADPKFRNDLMEAAKQVP
jgi:4-hydroxybutyrate CoA-transferase